MLPLETCIHNPNLQNKRTNPKPGLFPRSLNPLARFLFGLLLASETHTPQSRSTCFPPPTVVTQPMYKRGGDCYDFRVIKWLTKTKLKSICDPTLYTYPLIINLLPHLFTITSNMKFVVCTL